MKRTPLLDLGNVVVRVDFHPFLSWLAEKAGHADTQQVSALLRSSLFYELEFGNICRSEFARRVGKLYGIDITAPELEERFCTIFPGVVEGIEPLMEELAANGPLYCLSNTNEIHLNFIREHFPVMRKFTRVFASHEMGRRKPYPGIYRDVAEELDLEPRSLVFFDDVEANVQGALRAGLEAHLFDGVEGMRARLSRSDQPEEPVHRSRSPGWSRSNPPAKPEGFERAVPAELRPDAAGAGLERGSAGLKQSKDLDDNESGGGFGHG